jgi:ribosomal protein S18 acetylase RimI-like enzyme
LCLRPALAEDVPALAALATQVFLETYATEGVDLAMAQEVQALLTPAAFSEAFADPRRCFVVASLRERPEALIGFAQLLQRATHALLPQDGLAACELERLYLQQRFTGRGWGRALLRAAELQARQQGAQRLRLTAWAGNQRALAFYPRCDYRLLGDSVYHFEDAAYANKLFAREL